MVQGNYFTANGRYARTRFETLIPAGTVVTATGAVTGSVVELADAGDCRAILEWTANAGSGTATITLETGATAAGPWAGVGAAFTATSGATGTGRFVRGPLDRFVRANVTAFTGTSVTLGVQLECV